MRCLVVGSSVIDIFSEIATKNNISLTRDSVTLHLGDKVPTHIKSFALGGNGMNVSVGLSRFGLETAFYTYLGTDKLSQTIEEALQKEGIEILAEKEEGSSSLSYILDFDTDRIIFSHHPVKMHGFTPPRKKRYDLIFLSSIGDHWEKAYEKVIAYSLQTGTPIAYSPGSKQIHSINDIFFTALHHCEYLLTNRSEAELILKRFDMSHKTSAEMLTNLAKLGPHTISVTDGGKGAYATHNGNHYSIPSFSKDGKLEKTGAGDAYASGFLAGVIHTQDITEAMRWGAVNAHSVMQSIGAQNGLQTKESLLRILAKHATFKPEKVDN